MRTTVRTMIDCCTKDCPDRCADPNCHTYCQRYLEQRAELNEAAVVYGLDIIYEEKD